MAETTTITLRPDGTVQAGSWTKVGATSEWQALSDNADSSYVQLIPRCRNQGERLILSVPDLSDTLPDDAQIYSVGTRIRIQTVAAPSPQPQCCGWFSCKRPQNLLQTIVELIIFILFGWRCPRPKPSQPTVSWVDQDLEYLTTDPDGNPWTLAAFDAFTVQLGRDDSSTTPLKISELYIDVTYVLQGSVVVTTPTGTVTDTDPTGIETNTVRPTVRWEYSSPQSDPQQAFQVAIYSDAQNSADGFVAFVSTPTDGTGGWVFGEDQQWTGTVDLVNGTWWAYVECQPAWDGPGTLFTNIDSTTWIQDIAGAAIAELTVAEFDATFNRVHLQFEPGTGDGTEDDTEAFAVQVSRDLGSTWGPVRGSVLVAADGTNPITAYDYEAPPNTISEYRVLAYGINDTLYFAASDYSEVKSVTPVVNDIWCKDVLNPLLNSKLPVAYLGDTVTRRRVQGTFETLSGSNTAEKIVVDGPLYGIEGTLNLIFHIKQDADYLAAFTALDESQHTLLLQWPTGEQHYIKFGPGAVGSDMTYTWNLIPGANVRQYTQLQVSYVEVKQPPITS